jgi:hypothetical protein
LKKERMLEVLRTFFKEQKIKWATVNPNSQYRSIYTSYNNWQKKRPKELPPVKALWREKEFQSKKQEIINKKNK